MSTMGNRFVLQSEKTIRTARIVDAKIAHSRDLADSCEI